MSRKNRRPLILKLTFFAVLLVVFVAATFSIGIIWGQKKAIIKAQHDNRVETVNGLRQVAREAILVDDDTDMVNYVNLLKRSPIINYAMVISPDGRMRVHTDPYLIGSTIEDEPTQKAMAYRKRNLPLLQNVQTDKGKDIIDLSIPILLGFSPPEFQGTARIGFDKQNIEKEIDVSVRKATQGIIFAFGIALLVGLVGAILLAAFITKPLAELQKGSRLIGEGKLEHRIHVNTNDELRDLGEEFNLMAKKLGELDEMKRDFVSSVTHELRSPMTSIRGYMDLLLKGAAGDLNDTQKDYLSVIKNNAVRLGRFIDNLLDVAKIEANKLKLTPEVTDIKELMHEMEVLFKPQADQKKIKIVNQTPKDITDAFVDKDKIAEVLINLSSNAIKFTPDNGEMTLMAKEGSNHIELSVHDTGIGIPDGQGDKLFSKFEQIKTKKKGDNKAHQKGTGLGLAIVKGIVEAHGGKIWVKSPAPSGKGTAFYFTIPKMTDKLKAKLNS